MVSLVSVVQHDYNMDFADYRHAVASTFREQCVLEDHAGDSKVGRVSNELSQLYSLEYQRDWEVCFDGYLHSLIDITAALANQINTVDMAVPYDYESSAQRSEFGNIRDSFYILTTLNQYSIKSVVSLKDEAEGLLRIVLFSKDLRLADTENTLRECRQTLAQSLRKRRRRGVVPVFISTLWFLFSLAISVQGAFGMIGENSEAHDLALGLLLGWLPILILCSIVDRNPAAADDVREQINDLIDLVCKSLQDEAIVNEFIESFCTSSDAGELKVRVKRIQENVPFLQSGFLTSFAGQGRVRWHYGAAHPILSDIENCYVAEHGRDWLRNEEEARTKLVLGSVDRGLFWFDFRELWSISSAVVVVVGTSMGAFALSYFTPTVGLGCRSLGYLIFVIFSFALLWLEFLVWWFTTEEREEFRVPAIARRFTTATFVQMEERGGGMFRRMQSWSRRGQDWFQASLLEFLPTIAAFFQPLSNRTKTRDSTRKSLEHAFTELHNFTTRQWTHRFFFIPFEVINASWLCYIILAQTFGSYTNCKCDASIYGFGGGYIDLAQDIFSDDRWLKWYWSIGTSLSIGIMGVGLFYVVLEVCVSFYDAVPPYPPTHSITTICRLLILYSGVSSLILARRTPKMPSKDSSGLAGLDITRTGCAGLPLNSSYSSIR
jgi:hypothetical protein